MAVLDPSATRSYLSFGPAHLFQHLLAKFGVIVAPGAVSWIHGPLLPSPGWSRKGKFKQALLAFPESSWYWISSTKALHCKKNPLQNLCQTHHILGVNFTKQKTPQQK